MQFSTEDEIIKAQQLQKHRMEYVEKNCTATSGGSKNELNSTLDTNFIIASVNVLVEKSRNAKSSEEAVGYALAAEKLIRLPIIVEAYS